MQLYLSVSLSLSPPPLEIRPGGRSCRVPWARPARGSPGRGVCACVSVCVCMCMWTYMYMYITCICIRIRVCVCVCIYIYIYIYIQLFTHAHIHNHIHVHTHILYMRRERGWGPRLPRRGSATDARTPCALPCTRHDGPLQRTRVCMHARMDGCMRVCTYYSYTSYLAPAGGRPA